MYTYWSLIQPDVERDIINKLKLIISWVFGRRVINMTHTEVLKYTIEEYKKCNYSGFLRKKYGEHYC